MGNLRPHRQFLTAHNKLGEFRGLQRHLDGIHWCFVTSWRLINHPPSFAPLPSSLLCRLHSLPHWTKSRGWREEKGGGIIEWLPSMMWRATLESHMNGFWTASCSIHSTQEPLPLAFVTTCEQRFNVEFTISTCKISIDYKSLLMHMTTSTIYHGRFLLLSTACYLMVTYSFDSPLPSVPSPPLFPHTSITFICWNLNWA